MARYNLENPTGNPWVSALNSLANVWFAPVRAVGTLGPELISSGGNLPASLAKATEALFDPEAGRSFIDVMPGHEQGAIDLPGALGFALDNAMLAGMGSAGVLAKRALGKRLPGWLGAASKAVMGDEPAMATAWSASKHAKTAADAIPSVVEDLVNGPTISQMAGKEMPSASSAADPGVFKYHSALTKVLESEGVPEKFVSQDPTYWPPTEGKTFQTPKGPVAKPGKLERTLAGQEAFDQFQNFLRNRGVNLDELEAVMGDRGMESLRNADVIHPSSVLARAITNPVVVSVEREGGKVAKIPATMQRVPDDVRDEAEQFLSQSWKNLEKATGKNRTDLAYELNRTGFLSESQSRNASDLLPLSNRNEWDKLGEAIRWLRNVDDADAAFREAATPQFGHRSYASLDLPPKFAANRQNVLLRLENADPAAQHFLRKYRSLAEAIQDIDRTHEPRFNIGVAGHRDRLTERIHDVAAELMDRGVYVGPHWNEKAGNILGWYAGGDAVIPKWLAKTKHLWELQSDWDKEIARLGTTYRQNSERMLRYSRQEDDLVNQLVRQVKQPYNEQEILRIAEALNDVPYAGANSVTRPIPPMPFAGPAWLKAVLNQALHDAEQSGADWLSWSPGNVVQALTKGKLSGQVRFYGGQLLDGSADDAIRSSVLGNTVNDIAKKFGSKVEVIPHPTRTGEILPIPWSVPSDAVQRGYTLQKHLHATSGTYPEGVQRNAIRNWIYGGPPPLAPVEHYQTQAAADFASNLASDIAEYVQGFGPTAAFRTIKEDPWAYAARLTPEWKDAIRKGSPLLALLPAAILSGAALGDQS